MESKTLPYVVLALLALVAVCFVQSCLMFWGHDRGAVPSAATLWVGNGWRSNAELMTFLTGYLLFPLTSALFADSLYDDRRRGASYLLATRSAARRYVISGAACAFIAAFAVTLVVLGTSQALAFIAFPVEAESDAYYVMYDLAATSDLGYSLLEAQPFADLLFLNRYAYNLFYCLYDAVFAGAMALASYATSLYLRNNRLVILGLPTMLLLAFSAVAPFGFSPAVCLLPQFGMQGAPEAGVLLAPLFVACLSLVLVGAPLLLKRDVCI